MENLTGTGAAKVSRGGTPASRGRRDFLYGCAAMAATGFVRANPKPGGRVVIVGGGWGGLGAARHLREIAPGLDVVLLERQEVFRSLPLSNKWLANLVDERLLVHDYAAAAKALGYAFVRTDVSAVDRDRRQVITAAGPIGYDWLILSAGIRHDYAAWFGDDRRAADHAREHYPCAFTVGDELAVLKKKLDAFPGGDLLMTLPPMPYRCPPAPYERAAMIGSLIKSRRIKGRLIVLDPNPISPAYRRVFETNYRDQITYLPDRRVQSVDPFARRVVTEVEDFRFDDAILMPPQQAADLVWQAGLIGRDRDGKPTGWADQESIHLHARDDERVFVIGDAMGPVSPLFGHYPKSGHMANRHGSIAAREIAARASGAEPPTLLPESVCYLFTDFDPMAMVRMEARYRIRGDGLIEQTVKQFPDANPRDEDVAWAAGMFGEFFGGAR